MDLSNVSTRPYAKCYQHMLIQTRQTGIYIFHLFYSAIEQVKKSSTSESPFTLLYGREPRLPSDLDRYNDYRPNDFIDNLHAAWVEAKRNVERQARINKTYYDSKYITPAPTYKIGDYIRIKQPKTKTGLKKEVKERSLERPIQNSKSSKRPERPNHI